jgi:hypothetical protein
MGCLGRPREDVPSPSQLIIRRLRRGSQDLSLTWHRVAAVRQQGELEAAVAGAVACAEEGRPAA